MKDDTLHKCLDKTFELINVKLKHCAPSGLEVNVGELNNTMRILEDWLSNNFIISTYLLNAKKILKQMMSRVSAKITSTIAPDKRKWKSVKINRVTSHKFLGVWIQMDWSRD